MGYNKNEYVTVNGISILKNITREELALVAKANNANEKELWDGLQAAKKAPTPAADNK